MRRKSIVALAIAATMVSSMSMTAYATEVGSMYATLRQEADGSYSYHEKHYKENGNWAKNEWVHYGDAFGCKVYKYFGNDGDVLTNTTTPDGYKVNSYGEWYEHCPGAAYCTVDDYFADQAYYPFSYDGLTLKNDYLGMAINYTAEDYEAGYNLEISNVQGVYLYSCWVIKTPLGGSIGLGVYPTERDEYVAGRLGREEDNLSINEIVREEITFAGKTFSGYRQITTPKDFESPSYDVGLGFSTASYSNEKMDFITETEFKALSTRQTRTMLELNHKNPENSGSMSIHIVPVSEADEAQIVEWLNTHITFTK